VQLLTVFTIFITFRLEYFVVLPKQESFAKDIVLSVFKIGFLMTLINTFGFWHLSDFVGKLLGNENIEPWLVLVPTSAFLVCISVALQQAVQRERDFRSTGVAEVLNKAGYVTSVFSGALFLPSLLGLVLGSAVGSLIKSVWLSTKLTSAYWRGGFRSDFQAVSSYKQGAIIMSSSSLLATLGTFSPLVVISNLYGSNALGQFALVISTLYLPSAVLGQAIGQVYFQRAASSFSKGESFYSLFKVTLIQLCKIAVPLYILVMVSSYWLYPIVFGDQWQEAGLYATMMCLASGVAFVSSPLDRTCMVVGAWWYMGVWNGLRLLLAIAVSITAWLNEWSPQLFVGAYAVQMSAIYLVDLYASYRFSKSST
tara:strand:+ start:1678 stop:2781 length:1104 start_codon:yes stop_codon:yes gene_type:complete